MRICIDIAFFHAYIEHKGKSYKVIIDKGSCVNIISKIAVKNMDLKVQSNPQSYNVLD